MFKALNTKYENYNMFNIKKLNSSICIFQNKCLPIAGYKQACSDTNQCHIKLGVGSVCDSGICVCNATHEPYNDGQTDDICIRKICT